MEQQNNSKDRRKGITIMGQLIGLVKPLLPIMFLAILLGVLGYLCAIFLTILAGYPAGTFCNVRILYPGNAGSNTDYSCSVARHPALWRTVLQSFYCI